MWPKTQKFEVNFSGIFLSPGTETRLDHLWPKTGELLTKFWGEGICVCKQCEPEISTWMEEESIRGEVFGIDLLG